MAYPVPLTIYLDSLLYPMSEIMIEAKALSREFGFFRAVDKVSFTVSKGDVLGLLGPNGAGKSTTMKMLTGFLPPSGGEAYICGHNVWKSPVEAKRQFGYLPENAPLYQEMTVLEFLRFVAGVRGYSFVDAERQIRRVVQLCHLNEVRHQTIETLSKGYRRRTGMAQAVLHDPACLIMDEPTDGLDPNQKQEVRRFICDMSHTKAIVLSTHILEEVEAMCNRIIIISEGKLVENSTKTELLSKYSQCASVSIRLPEKEIPEVRAILAKQREIAVVEARGEQLLLRPIGVVDLEAVVRKLAGECEWSQNTITREPIRLEDVFSALTRTRETTVPRKIA